MRCNCIAQRQASQKGKQTSYVEGQAVGPHTFVGYVGGRENALYIYLKCKCGTVFPYKRDQVSQLSRVKPNGRTTEHCKSCMPNHNQYRKPSAA
jgi:hypothetical protein